MNQKHPLTCTLSLHYTFSPAFQENVLAESEMMIRDTRRRLESALGDLQNLVAELAGLEGIKGTEEWKAMEEVKEAAEKLFD